jgi:hypothetical protein
MLIRCSKPEARRIRELAKTQRRTISGYVLSVLMRAIRLDESFARMKAVGVNDAPFAKVMEWYGLDVLPTGKPPGPRTSMLLSCSTQEAARIRLAAKTREISISGFILHTLRSTWNITAEGNAALPEAHWPVTQFERAPAPQASRTPQQEKFRRATPPRKSSRAKRSRVKVA